MLTLVAQLALAGLDHSPLIPLERADFFQGLGFLLPPPTSEAARYAATCIRESHRAQREFYAALATFRTTVRKGAAPR
jgi:hypothetical protein